MYMLKLFVEMLTVVTMLVAVWIVYQCFVAFKNYKD